MPCHAMPCEAMRGKSQAPKPSKHRPCHYDPTPPARRLQLPSATKSCLTVLLAYLLIRLLGPYPYLYMVSAAQASSSGATSTSRVSLTATPLLSLGCFSNASLGMAERLLPLGISGLAFFFQSCPVLYCTCTCVCASPVGSSAVGKFSLSLCPSVRKKNEEKATRTRDTPYPIPSHFELY